ncbi:hypothetical protein [Tropicimonas sp. IMCC34043]|uniref:hypothetical protein n=1 Tax=Tropicimonas sp. IMCC34043 TaxID=2248760 RepID=UPI000E223D38|nr:hypothetical protein [Tropicimonas sp. IMCC34043]
MVLNATGELWCEDERRGAVLLDPAHPLNGLDFVEYFRDEAAPAGRQFRLEATFLKPPPPLLAGDAQILGGVRIVGLRVLSVEPDPGDPLRLRVFADREGDFSTYVLAFDHPGLDPERSQARFGFKAGCPTEFDCRVPANCPPDLFDEPDLDYLAKDYQSFRRLFLDLVAQRNPDWKERLPADFSIALVEMLAYVGDYLSYLQDAGPATESFFETCLHRISMQRHTRLIDYPMHDGRNAACFVQFDLTPAPDPAPRVVPAGARLVTRIATPLIGMTQPPGVVLPATADFDTDPALEGATVFETTALIRTDAAHNLLYVHTFGDTDCCLGTGTRQAWLYGIDGDQIYRPAFADGDYLLLEEVQSPVTGAAADADPTRRAVVRIAGDPLDTTDPVFTDTLTLGELTARQNPAAEAPMPLQRVTWRVEDALTRPFCVSNETAEAGLIRNVTILRGNVAPADHGRTLRREGLTIAPGTGRWPLATTDLPDAGLTRHAGPFDPQLSADGRPVDGRHDLDAPPRAAAPAVYLRTVQTGGARRFWTPVPHLGDSGAYDRHFVAETDEAGETTLRFGDDTHGRAPRNIASVTAFYRVGGGRAGNLSSGALVHAVAPDLGFWADPGAAVGPVSLDPGDPTANVVFAEIAQVRQPLPARGGTDPETIAAARALAPEEVQAIQFRAVTAADWQEMALRHPGVAAAKARIRWIGSWHCVFVAIHPRDTGNLVRLPGGGVRLSDEFAARMRSHLTRFKLAGTDLTVRAAQYVPLEIDIKVCVCRGHYRGQVLKAVADALSNRILPGGDHGFFHLPDLDFGEDIYLSRLYAALEAVEGVTSAEVTLFKRYWEVAGDELARGRIALGEFEIARLDNDPNFPENGVLRLTAMGGV